MTSVRNYTIPLLLLPSPEPSLLTLPLLLLLLPSPSLLPATLPSCHCHCPCHPCHRPSLVAWYDKQQNADMGGTFFLELYFDSVILVGIGQYFLGIYHTDTKGKLGRYTLVLFFWQEPLFFLERVVMAPFLRGPAPILRKKGFPAKP
jgi:hypothetical protein